RSVFGRGAQKARAIACRQVVHDQPAEDLLLEQPSRLRWCQAEFSWQPRRNGEELEAAMPRRRGRWERLLSHRVHDRLRGTALRPEIHDAREEDARIEKCYGHRFR